MFYLKKSNLLSNVLWIWKHYGKVCKAARQEWDQTSFEGNRKGILTDILHKIHFDIRLEEFRKSKERRWRKKAKSVLLGISAAVLIPLLLLNIWQWQNRALESNPVFTEITCTEWLQGSV